jgi:hypothetical protein
LDGSRQVEILGLSGRCQASVRFWYGMAAATMEGTL